MTKRIAENRIKIIAVFIGIAILVVGIFYTLSNPINFEPFSGPLIDGAVITTPIGTGGEFTIDAGVS